MTRSMESASMPRSTRKDSTSDDDDVMVGARQTVCGAPHTITLASCGRHAVNDRCEQDK